jgi:phosphoserine phosphatase
MILPLAQRLGIDDTHLYANLLLFHPNGDYAGFDEKQPTCHSGGKARVIGALMGEHGYKRVIMVGDGATDMAARPPAAAAIGYGGVVVRPSVRDTADWFVTDFNQLLRALKAEGRTTCSVTSKL